MKFSDVLLNFRARYKLTQKEAAEVLGKTQREISCYETGKNEPTKRNQLLILTKITDYEKRGGNV